MPKGLKGISSDSTKRIINMFSKINPNHKAVNDYCKQILDEAPE
jgi:phage host-nuclease inhibitor protein Gam